MPNNDRQNHCSKLSQALEPLLVDANGNQAALEFLKVTRSGLRARLRNGKQPGPEGPLARLAAAPQVFVQFRAGKLAGLEIPFRVAARPAEDELELTLITSADLPPEADPALSACAAKGQRLLCLLEEAAQPGAGAAPAGPPAAARAPAGRLKELLQAEAFLDNLVSLVLENLLENLPSALLPALTEEAVARGRAHLLDFYRPRQAELLRRLTPALAQGIKGAPERDGIQVFRDVVNAALRAGSLDQGDERASLEVAILAIASRAQAPAAAHPAASDPEFAKWFDYHLKNGEQAHSLGAGYSAAEFFLESYRDRTQYADEIAYINQETGARRQHFGRAMGQRFAERDPGLAEAVGQAYREEAWRMYQASHGQVAAVQDMLSFYPRVDLQERPLNSHEQELKDIKFAFLNRLCDLIAPHVRQYVRADRQSLDAAADAEAAEKALREQVEQADPDQLLAEHLPRLIAAAGLAAPDQVAAARAFAQAQPKLPLTLVDGQPLMVLGGPGLKELERLVARNFGQKHALAELGPLVNVRKVATDPKLREALSPIVMGRLLRLIGDRERYLEMLYLVAKTPAEVGRVFGVSGRNADGLLERIQAAALDLSPRPKPRRRAAAPEPPA